MSFLKDARTNTGYNAEELHFHEVNQRLIEKVRAENKGAVILEFPQPKSKLEAQNTEQAISDKKTSKAA